jgi:hypothetical protein
MSENRLSRICLAMGVAGLLGFIPVGYGKEQGDRKVDLQAEGVVVGYDQLLPLINSPGVLQTQMLLVRVERVLKGHEKSRYIRVEYRYGSGQQPLATDMLERAKTMRLPLTRDSGCDGALKDVIYIKGERENGEKVEPLQRIKFLDKEAEGLPRNTVVPCYALYSSNLKHK